MNKISVLVLALLLSLGFSHVSLAADANAKPASCKQEAKDAGLKDKNEIKDYVKKCKADRKAAKAK